MAANWLPDFAQISRLPHPAMGLENPDPLEQGAPWEEKRGLTLRPARPTLARLARKGTMCSEGRRFDEEYFSRRSQPRKKTDPDFCLCFPGSRAGFLGSSAA